MALTAAQRQKNKSDRDMGVPETYKSEPKPSKEEIIARVSQHKLDYDYAVAQDATGKFYKSECRPCVDLLAIYEGANILDKEIDENEAPIDRRKTPKKKENRPNPSQQRVQIRATEFNGIKLEPNCNFEFRLLKEVDEVVSFQRWLDLRDKARKNLLWLGRLLGYGLFYSVHQYVCDQFVQKNFDGMYFPGYTVDDFHDVIRAQKRFTNDGVTECREMILLESRGAYKSTIDGIDCVQWLINCPDIRIMIMTGVKSLAKRFAKQIKKSFYLPAKGTPTAFQLLFPEYTLTGVDGRSESPLECPAANFNQKEPNLWVTSIESSNTGDHCDIRKADDVVTPKNSADKELREELKFEFDGTDDVLDQWGFSDVIGTRYFTDDWYGTRLLPNPETGEVAPLRYSCRGCWSLPPQVEADYKAKKISLKQIIDGKLGTLTFPYKLTWAELRKTLNKKGERSFKNQQLNEATDAKADDAFINHFDEDVLKAHCYQRSAVPREMEIIQTWDFAYSDHKTSDFSVGVTAGIYQTTKKELAVVILEVIFDKWKSSELPIHMLSFYEKYRPTKVYIEEANGVNFLMGNIKNSAQIKGSDMPSRIYLRPVSVHANAKGTRVKDLEFLLGHDRLWFVLGPWLDETFKQLTQYTGKKSTTYRKDDIPDAMSFITEHLPPSALLHNPDPKQVEKEHEERRIKDAKRDVYNRMFGGPSPTAPKPATPVSQEPVIDPRRAMINKLFGGNGMRA